MPKEMDKAKAVIIIDQPFFSSMLLRMPMVEDINIPTMATDGLKIYYNPSILSGKNKLWSVEETTFVLAHEIMHIALEHHLRHGNRDHSLWNVATDFAINYTLVNAFSEAGLSHKAKAPKGILLDKKYDGMSAEEIYSLIEKQAAKYIHMAYQAGDGSHRGDCGSCGTIEPMPGRSGGQASEAEKAEASADVKVMVAQAAQVARMMGKLPSSLGRMVSEIVAPRIDYRDVLREFIDMTARNDYSWTPCSNKYVWSSTYVPGVRSEELPPIAIAIDTSGSIGNDQLTQFFGEINGILSARPTKIYMVFCDAAVSEFYTVETDGVDEVLEPREFKITGGGGTDFRPAFTFIEEHCPDAVSIIYLTDMFGVFPDEAPDKPTLWVSISNVEEAPFGQVVKLTV